MDEAAPNPKCPGCQALLKQVAMLEARIARLEARLRENSSNSNRPPSSDPPWMKPSGGTPGSEKKRGGQPGHEKSGRDLLPPDEVHCCKPTACERCGTALRGDDRAPQRHQVTELPPTRTRTDEYQLHALECPACGHWTRAELPAGVPRGAFGPRLQSMVVALTGVYRMSRRNAQQWMLDAFSVKLSIGVISKIERQMAETLAQPHEAALQAIRRAPVVHSDETSWREANQSAWLWTAVSEKLSVFVIRASRGSDVAKELIGEDFAGIHVSDRWAGYNWIDIEQRQVCWAHLFRDFRKIADSGELFRSIGESLEKDARELFSCWHRVRAGTLERSRFQRKVRVLRERMHFWLETGATCDGWRAPSLCRGILEVESALWTFVEREGIEPTNNTAERALRSAVIWRKTSLGTQSARGSRFAERILTCVGTLRKRGRNVLDYLTAARDAAIRGASIPSFTSSRVPQFSHAQPSGP